MSKLNRLWTLRNRPQGTLGADDLELIEAPVGEPGEGQILVRNVYLSLDPTNRIWMSDREQYLPPVGIGDVMRGTTLGVVEQSKSSRFSPGDVVLSGEGGWRLYAVLDAARAAKVRLNKNVPLTAHLSVLGPTGLTAYFGLLHVANAREGDTVVVSAAAGAVGSVAGQLARFKGCRVIGIAGGSEKCRWIVDELGFDAAVDYKSEDVGDALDRLCPDGIDVDFENVGGAIMDAVYSRLRVGGRMALCGMISGYNQEGPLPGPADFGRILMKRLTIRGFIVTDFLSSAGEALRDLSAWVAEGKLKWRDQVVDGIEQAPSAMQRLFTGENSGKLVVRLSEEPG